MTVQHLMCGSRYSTHNRQFRQKLLVEVVPQHDLLICSMMITNTAKVEFSIATVNATVQHKSGICGHH